MPFLTLKTYLTWAKAHAPKGPFTFIFSQVDPHNRGGPICRGFGTEPAWGG